MCSAFLLGEKARNVRTVVIILMAAAGNILLGRVLGDAGKLIGLIAGLIFGVLLVQPGVILRSSVFLQRIEEDADKIMATGASKYERYFIVESVWFFGVLILNAVVWTNMPMFAIDLAKPAVSIQIKVWSTFLPIIESHYQQIYAYSGIDRATRISYVYATSFSLFTLFGIWRIRPALRILLVQLIVGQRREPRRRFWVFILVIAFLSFSVFGGWFALVGSEIDLLSTATTISRSDYFIGDSYWEIWDWVLFFWMFGTVLPFSLAFLVLALHWSLFFPKRTEN